MDKDVEASILQEPPTYPGEVYCQSPKHLAVCRWCWCVVTRWFLSNHLEVCPCRPAKVNNLPATSVSEAPALDTTSRGLTEEPGMYGDENYSL